MNVYICYRWEEKFSYESYMGALIISAPSEKDAIDLFKEIEYDEEPTRIELIDGVNALESKVLYNDHSR